MAEVQACQQLVHDCYTVMCGKGRVVVAWWVVCRCSQTTQLQPCSTLKLAYALSKNRNVAEFSEAALVPYLSVKEWMEADDV